MEKQELITQDDRRAAKLCVTVGEPDNNTEVWQDRHGRWYLNERSARYGGSNAIKCEKCDEVVLNKNAWQNLCIPCHKLKENQEYVALPSKIWDGQDVVCENNGDYYCFDGYEGLFEHFDNCEISSVIDAKLVFAEPYYIPEFSYQNIEEQLEEFLPGEETELPDWFVEALDTLNKVIKDHSKKPTSWFPSEIRLDHVDLQQKYDEWRKVS